MAETAKIDKSEFARVSLMDADGKTWVMLTLVRNRREESFILTEHDAVLAKNALGWQLDKLKITE